jgi:predicted ATPase/DNA-binding XRE family transcriptional regulator
MTAHDAPVFGDLIRQRRLATGLTQDALAEKAGISTRAVTDLERGVIRAPRRDTLEMLAGALDLSHEERREWHRMRRQLSTRRAASSSGTSNKTYLPQPPNPLLGRDHEVSALVDLLRQPEVRLVTTSGPGGVGKTRVAIAVGHRLVHSFADGVRFIELAAVRDPNLLLPAIAQQLGLREGSNQAVRDRLTTFLSRRRLLLILDNFEQLLLAAPDIAMLLSHSTDLKMLVTSRARLQLQAEHEFPLAPLPLPEWDGNLSYDEIELYAAVDLFVQRSKQIAPEFHVNPENVSAIAAICSHLDGLPLAIELTAARAKVLPPHEMLRRLVHRLAFLTGGVQDVPDRHRTMRGAIAWSYDLLSPAEQSLFRQLSIFVGGWTFEAAEAMAPPGIDVLGGLTTLVDNSLVFQTAQPDGRYRFNMLETIRGFGLEQLDELGELNLARQQHTRYFLQLVEEAEPHLRGAGQPEWLTLLADELANLRAALEWSQRPEVDPDIGLRLVAALSWFWESRGYITEGRRWLTGALERGTHRSGTRMRALSGAGWMAHIQRDSDSARSLLTEALHLAVDIQDRWAEAWILHLLGRVAYFDDDASTARRYGEQSLSVARQLGDDWIIAWDYHLFGLADFIAGDLQSTRKNYETSLRIRERIEYPEGISLIHGLLGVVALREGDEASALRLLREGLVTGHELGARWLIVNWIVNIVLIAAGRGEASRAARLAGFVAMMGSISGANPIPINDITFQNGIQEARELLGREEFDRHATDKPGALEAAFGPNRMVPSAVALPVARRLMSRDLRR